MSTDVINVWKDIEIRGINPAINNLENEQEKYVTIKVHSDLYSNIYNICSNPMNEDNGTAIFYSKHNEVFIIL